MALAEKQTAEADEYYPLVMAKTKLVPWPGAPRVEDNNRSQKNGGECRVFSSS